MEIWERWREGCSLQAEGPVCGGRVEDLPFQGSTGAVGSSNSKNSVKSQPSLCQALEQSKLFELLKTKQGIPSSVPVTLYKPSEAGKEQSFVLNHLLISVPEHFVSLLLAMDFCMELFSTYTKP